MARLKGKELCLLTLSQSLHLESCLAMQIRSLAHNDYPQRTRLSSNTVYGTFKWNQILDQTAESFRQPSTQRKHSTGARKLSHAVQLAAALAHGW